MGWMGWALLGLVVFALAFVALWQWAVATRATWLLDEVDSWFTSGMARHVAGPVSLGEQPEQQLHVWVPASAAKGDAPRPVLVFIHGGGWSSGSPFEYGFVARNFANEGFVTVNLGYRLGNDGKFPAMLEDSAAGVKWVYENIADHGGDPDRIYLMGHSAGAYNAVMLGLDRQWLGREGLPDNVLKGVVGLAGPCDFLPLDGEGVERAFGDAPDLAATQPINFARADAPPMLLLTGGADVTVKPRNSSALATRMSVLGVAMEPVILDGMDHAGSIVTMARPFDRDRRAKDAVLAFLRRPAADQSASVPVQAETR
ncbi:MAG: alpha/beta hydrolase [Sphingomonadaceae bacterium]|nr:alpha/beta hydrolase [Sphingomonadaceae bacterium]